MKNSNNIILVVEDDDVSCSLFREIFEQENIKTYLIVKTGEQAVEVCKNNGNIGLVLLDLRLPGITGFETLKRIKK